MISNDRNNQESLTLLPSAPQDDLSRLRHALSIARRGFRVFPVEANGKRPSIKSWPALAARSDDQVKNFWRQRAKANIGALASSIVDPRTGEEINTIVIDIDVKNADGFASLEKLEREFGNLPTTFTTRTPTGGKHIWLHTSEPGKNSVGKLGPGIDTRGANGYCLMPGSEIDGIRYVIETDTTIAAAPERWLNVLNEPHPTYENSLSTPVQGDPFSPQELTEMLRHIPPDCSYEQWRNVAAALHAACCTDEEFDKRFLFVRWSRGELHA